MSATLTPAAAAAAVGTYPQEIRRLARETRSARLPGAPIIKGRRGGKRVHLRWDPATVGEWYAAALAWLAEQPIPEPEQTPTRPAAPHRRNPRGHGSRSGGRVTSGSLLAQVYAKAG